MNVFLALLLLISLTRSWGMLKQSNVMIYANYSLINTTLRVTDASVVVWNIQRGAVLYCEVIN